MKDRITSKLIDTLATFLGSLAAIFFYSKIEKQLKNIYKSFGWDDEIINKVSGFIFSSIIALGFLITLLIFWCVTTFFSYFLRKPLIEVHFLNSKDEKKYELDFRSSPLEPLDLKIVFTTNFNTFQLWFLRKVLKGKIRIGMNPKTCSIELTEGFIASDEDYQLKGDYINFDLFSKYRPSSDKKSINTEITLLLVHSTNDAEMYLELDLSESNRLLKYIYIKYCKFKLEDFLIRG